MSCTNTQPTVYAIYDKLANTFACTFVSNNDATAERQFFDLISSPEAMVFSINYNDFVLVKFDDFKEVRHAHDFAETLIDRTRSERKEKFLDALKPIDKPAT